MNSKVIIIAEAGINHNGNLQNAKKLVEKAAKAGADYVKFQTFNTENLVTKKASLANYQKTKSINETQFDLLSKLSLSAKMHEILIDHCKKNKIRFMTTAFDFESLEMISKYNLEIYKIPSGEINNRPYLQKIGSYNKKLILSTGASLIDEIKDALDILKSAGTNKENITVLHCNSAYPTPFSDVNLLAMKKLKLDLNVNVGYSDHSLGIEVPIAAVALGASVIEKHFTLDKNQAGPDHKCSLEPYELEEMVKSIRNIELSLGSEIKKISLSEKENIKIIRKSIVASKRIKKGDIFSEDNITVKRPGDGISPMKWEFVLGRISKKNFEKDQFIEL